MFRPVIATCVVSCAAFLGLDIGVGSAATIALVPHRAVYDIVLKDASERSGIASLSGRMVYEFTGSECKGYTVSFRYVTRTDMGEGQKLTDQQTRTFEDLGHNIFKFETRTFSDDRLDSQVSGSARSADNKVVVRLAKPQEEVVSLAESRFPTEHMIDVIKRASRGERFFESRLFDGSDTGNKDMMTTTIVGKPLMPKADDIEATKLSALTSKAYWPVSMSYFEDTRGNDELPVYQISFKLYDNGITRDLVMDYGDFVLSGTLANLELLKGDDCKK